MLSGGLALDSANRVRRSSIAEEVKKLRSQAQLTVDDVRENWWPSLRTTAAKWSTKGLQQGGAPWGGGKGGLYRPRLAGFKVRR